MNTIHLIEGPVGSGKSTFAANLSDKHHAPRLVLDDWMAKLFSPDKPDGDFMQWYITCKNRCIRVIWDVALEILSNGSDVILELGLIRLSDRVDFQQRLEAVDNPKRVYVLDAPRELRRARIQNRNREQGETYSMQVPDHIFELASNMWEPIDKSEFPGCDLQFVSTGY